MLVQVLAEYADTYLKEQLGDAAWEKKPVPFLLSISRQGTFDGAIPRMKVVTRGNKQVQVPQEMEMPRSPVNRNSGHHPLLAADDIAYVLGVGPWTKKDAETTEAHHAAFVDLLRKAAADTGDEALASCAAFYDRPEEVEKARAEFAENSAKEGTLIALATAASPLVNRAAVADFWRKHYSSAFTERMEEGATGECMVSGKNGPIAPTHEKIKGLGSLGGQAAGVSLMSFDKEAFRSYGWERNENSPVSPERAMAYVLALNDLLRNFETRPPGEGGSRRDIAGIAFLFWLREAGDFDVFKSLDPPDTATVDAMLKLEDVKLGDPNEFHLLGVSGNGGRLRVRYWVVESLPQIKQNMRQWHEQLRIVYPWDNPGPVRFWQLEYAIHREGEPPAHQTLALLRRAIEGRAQPLGYSMLSAALTRLRHPGEDKRGKDTKGTKKGSEQKDTWSLNRLRVPLGLIRMCINDIHAKRGAQQMSEGLDDSCEIPAYVCGRMMAEFEALQKASSETEVNSTVLDRYFGLASTYPALAFPKIALLAEKHKRKLRRDNGGAAYAIDERLRGLHSKLKPSAAGAYPAKLSLEGQGLFVLGYYHQKARSASEAKDASARKKSNEAATSNAEQES